MVGALAAWDRHLGQAIEILFLWSERWRERRMLRGLDTVLLGDVGLSHADAEGEAAKPFWRA